MINAKLQSIIDTKSAIGNAIVNKGGTITGETPFFNYAAQIDSIEVGGASKILYTNGGTLIPAGLSKTANADNLIEREYGHSTQTINNNALFAGGEFNGSNRVSIYNIALTRTNGTDLSFAKRQVVSASVNNNAIFFGGLAVNYQAINTVESFNSSLVKTVLTNSPTNFPYLSSGNLGNYALFGGGHNATGIGQTTVYAYDGSLTRTTPTALSVGRLYMITAGVGNFLLFAGGQINTSSPASARSNVVDAYNTSLTRSTPTALTDRKSFMGAATIGGFALFAGGYNSSSNNLNAVDAYNTSLTRSSPTALLNPTRQLAGTTIANTLALFAGGYNNVDTTNVVVSYNNSLTRTTETSLTNARYSFAGASLGDYALFAAGVGADILNSVEVYLYATSSYYNLTAPTLTGFPITYNYSFNDLGTGTVNNGQTLSQTNSFNGYLEFPTNIS
jgi:hypothetical protein